MSHFIVLNADATGRLIRLLDSYGKCHLARLEAGVTAEVGSELHGPKAAIGLHFLVEAQSGRRVSVDFRVLCVVRTAPPTPARPQPVLQRRLAVVRPLSRPEAAARRRHHAPADGAGPH